MKIVAAILAGGRASRLGGVLKPLLTVAGRRILDRQLEVLVPLCDEVLLLGDDPRLDGLGARLVPDRHPGRGPLSGLDAALHATDAEAVLLVGGDMPGLSRRALEIVLAAGPAADAAVPFVAGFPEPLHARYHRRVGECVAALLGAERHGLHDLLDQITVHRVAEAILRTVDPALLTLANVNTPDDLARLDALL
ncbi:MAG: molybdenum cofactor guanylyltransferase [Myxococcales bacterium]|nr:molybdenum cofactor guanylyltransferase [Myxococcales bacterium]